MRFALVGCAALLGPALLQAQVKLEVTPYFASYYATNHTMYRASNHNERQEAGPGIGLTAAYHFTRLLGVQASAVYVRSGIIPREPSQSGVISTLSVLPGALTFASAQLTLQPRRSNYYLALGPGIVKRSGEAWDNPAWAQLTDISAAVSFGIRARITPEWQFNIGIDGHLYQSDPDGDIGAGDYYQKRLQRDVMVTIGVPFALLGR
jgi:hypothetical protein